MKMKLTLKGLLTICFIAMIAFSSKAFTGNWEHWNYIVTASNHTILVNPPVVLLDGVAAPTTNCWIGVFYTTSNGQWCGGYSEWAGAVGSVSAFGVDVFEDGFVSGEIFIWKLLKVTGTDTTEYNGTATYNPLFLNQDGFAGNGLSNVTQINFVSELNLGVAAWVTPQSYCGLTSTEVVSVAVTNNLSGAVTDPFDVAYSINGGATWVTQTFTTTIPPNDTITLVFNQTADFSAFAGTGANPLDSTYNVKFKIMFSADTDSLDNMLSTQVTNMLLPTVIVSGLAPQYCLYANIAPIQLTGIPAGGTFIGDGVQGSTFLIGSQGFPFAGAGYHCVEYNFYDQLTGCVGADTICTNIYALPVANLTSPSTQICQYDTMCLTGTPAGGTFHGTYVNPTTGCFNPLTPSPPIFPIYYTYTDVHGCIDTSNVKNFTVNTLPSASFVNLDRAYCTNGTTTTLQGSPAGGMFSISSGVAVTGNQLNPSLLTPGLHTLKYLYIDLNGCKDDDSQNIKAFAPPVVTLTGLEPEYCRFDIADTLLGNPLNGIWSGATTTGIFNPVTVGNFNVVYTYNKQEIAFADTIFCTSFDTESTIVRALPVFDLAGSYQLTPEGDIETCKPDTVDLTTGSFPSGQYLWSTGATTKNITTTGFGGYTATVTNQYGCEFKDSIFIGGTDVEMIVNISPASNCTLSNAEPLKLQYTNAGTKVFQPSQKINFIGILQGGGTLNQYDNRTAPFKPGDTLTFQFANLLPNASILANVGQYQLLSYLHYDNLSGTYPDCKLTNDTLNTIIVNGGFPDPSFPGCPVYSNEPDTVVLNPGDFTSYQWSNGETTSSITNLTFNTQYIVTVTDEFGCQETIACEVFDIEELPFSYESMDVYPNPNNGEFTLHVRNKTYTTISFELLDMSGRVITAKEEETTMELTRKISMRERAKGVYFLKVFNGKDYAIQKIIKY